MAPVKITREIPLWGIMSACAAFGAQAIGMYYGQQNLQRELIAQREQFREQFNGVAADVKQINASLANTTIISSDQRARLEETQRRLADVEATVKAITTVQRRP